MKRVALIAALLGLAFAVLVGSRTGVAELQLPAVSKAQSPKAKPEQSSAQNSTSNSELARRIDKLIDDGPFASSRWGISVISLSDQTKLYSRNADRLFTPASNMKIYTTAVALDLLGADYRWRTSVYAKAQPDGLGAVNGDLVLYGRGAPDLVSRSKENNRVSLSQLADDLFARGIRRVRGNVIGDESYFRGNTLGDGWQWTDIQWYFGAEASALSVDENQIDLNITPSANVKDQPVVKSSDFTSSVTVQNRMTAGTQSTRPTIGINRGLSDNTIAVWGEMPPGSRGFGARLSVHNPALWAARLFLAALKDRGITIEGAAQARDSRTARSQRFDPTQATELAGVSSRPLSEIARLTNKESNNLFAELILRTLGRERGSLLESPEPPGRELGDEEGGVAIVRLWLARAGVSTNGLALHDGSGLSRLNLVTPDSTVQLLASISKTASAEPFRLSLPVGGKDGTLAGRLKNLGDSVTAKTGTLTYDNSLSGYLKTSDNRFVAFSIFCNDQTGRASSIRLIDQIVTLLSAFPHLPDEKTSKSQ